MEDIIYVHVFDVCVHELDFVAPGWSASIQMQPANAISFDCSSPSA